MTKEISRAVYIDLSKYKSTDDEKTYFKKLQEEGYEMNRAFLLPHSMKGRFEALVSALKEILDSSNMGKTLFLNEKLCIELKMLTQSICYLMNSTSYRENKYLDFDKDEIDRKLMRK